MIVMEILGNRDKRQQDTENGVGSRKEVREDRVSAEPLEQMSNVGLEQNEMDEKTWSMIDDTMSVFRSR